MAVKGGASLEKEILDGIRFTARRAYEEILEGRRGGKPVRKARLIFGIPEGGAIRLLRLMTDTEPDEALYMLAGKVMGISDENCLFYSGNGVMSAILREDAPDFHQAAALEASLAGRLARWGGRAARNMRLLVSAPNTSAPSAPAPIASTPSIPAQGAEMPENTGEPAEDEGIGAALRRCHGQLEHLFIQSMTRPGVRVFVFDGPSARRLSAAVFPRLPFGALENALREGDSEAASLALDDFWSSLSKEPPSERVLSVCLYRLAGMVGRVCHEQGRTEVREALERFCVAAGSGAESCEAAARALCASVTRQTGSTPPALRNDTEIIRYIESHYRERLTLWRLSGVFAQTPAEIGRIVRAETGRGFNEVLNELRVEHAKQLIASSGLKLSVVSRESGFPDYSHFVRMFERQTGTLPSHYKKNFGR